MMPWIANLRLKYSVACDWCRLNRNLCRGGKFFVHFCASEKHELTLHLIGVIAQTMYIVLIIELEYCILHHR
jgi:hypothetical protein